MPVSRIDIKDIVTGGSRQSGHTVFPGATYRPKDMRIIYKLNKHGDRKFSQLEVAFNALTTLFLQPLLTSGQVLVNGEDGEISGLASVHLCYSANERERRYAERYGISDENGHPITPFHCLRVQGNQLDFYDKVIPTIKDTPIYFFDQLDPGVFPMLAQLEQEGQITFDIDSLASILTTAFTLEEDDLHKGNLGFYLTKRDGKTHVVFQTIDPDMKMADSIMSYLGPRVFNWRHGQNAFKITARDLQDFPVLQDSGFWYWLTKKRYLTKPNDRKTYSTHEVRAFSALNQRADFQQAKWRNFYKHILMPTEMIQEAISASFDPENPADQANRAMIVQAVLERVARLRVVLLSMPDFRRFVSNMSRDEHAALIDEMLFHVPQAYKAHVADIIAQRTDHYRSFIQPDGIQDGDTPLHVAIRLGEYSPIMWKSFREFANQPNAQGERPLDIALKQFRDHPKSALHPNIRANPAWIMLHLLKKGVEKTEMFRALPITEKARIKNFRIPYPHIEKAGRIAQASELIDLLRDVGEDTMLTLKMKKQMAKQCVKFFLKTHPNLDMTQLRELKQNICGNGIHQPPRPELQYIRQLRSRLWLVRQIRGLLGGTATQVALGEMIDVAIKSNRLPGPGSLSMFHREEPKRDDERVPGSPTPS